MYEYPSREYFVREYLEKGRTREELAQENHVSIATIKSHLYQKRIVKPPLIDKDKLYNLYVVEKKTMKEIAKILHHDRNAIARAIKAYGITKENHYSQYDGTLDDEWLMLYLEDGMSTFAIAKMYGVSHGTVKKHLVRNGIHVRDCSTAQRRSKGKEPLSPDVFNYEIMYDLYVAQRLTLNQLGEKYNCTPHTIRERLTALNIPIRSQSEVKIGLLVGPDHPNWKGGLSDLSQRLREFHQTNLAPLSRKRDNYRCVLCGSKSNLHSHHVVPFSWIVAHQLQLHPELDPNNDVDQLYNIIIKDPTFLDIGNLVTYCRDCHLFIIHGYKKTTSSQASYQDEGSTTISEESTL